MAGRIPGVFLCQLPGDVDQQSLADHFQRTWGLYVQGIKLMDQLDGSCSALVDLDSQEDADQVRNCLLLACYCLLASALLLLALHERRSRTTGFIDRTYRYVCTKQAQQMCQCGHTAVQGSWAAGLCCAACTTG